MIPEGRGDSFENMQMKSGEDTFRDKREMLLKRRAFRNHYGPGGGWMLPLNQLGKLASSVPVSGVPKTSSGSRILASVSLSLSLIVSFKI